MWPTRGPEYTDQRSSYRRQNCKCSGYPVPNATVACRLYGVGDVGRPASSSAERGPANPLSTLRRRRPCVTVAQYRGRRFREILPREVIQHIPPVPTSRGGHGGGGNALFGLESLQRGCDVSGADSHWC